MTIYRTRPRRGSYGYPIGVLLLEQDGLFVPGDVGNAGSYDFPVFYKTVAGATIERVTQGDQALQKVVVEAARDLEIQGVRAITSTSSAFIMFQNAAAASVRIPVFLSSLLQLKFISFLIGKNRTLGIIAADSRHLKNRVLEMNRADQDFKLVVCGMERCSEEDWTRLHEQDRLDTGKLADEIVAVARTMAIENGHLGAILLEGGMMPTYSKAVQDAVSLPVFDFMTMIDFAKNATHQTRRGLYY